MKAVNGAWPVSQLGSETARPCSRGAAPTASSLASRHRPSSSRQLTTAIERRHAATATSSTPRGSHAFRLSTRPSHLTLRAGARTSNAFAECSAAAFNVLFRGGATTLSKKSLESGKSSTSVQLLEARSKSRCLTPTCRWLRPVQHRSLKPSRPDSLAGDATLQVDMINRVGEVTLIRVSLGRDGQRRTQ